ncbi:MAG: ABC transporter substrate-binding protein [Enterocloster sp.]
MKKWIGTLIMGCVIMSLAACANTAEERPAAKEAKEKIVVTDVRGKAIELDSIPTRVASVARPFPYIFFSVLGENDYLVGCNPGTRETYEESMLRYMYPQFEKADTSWVDSDDVVNVEELMKLKPDVVFCYTSRQEEIDKMEEAGLTVAAIDQGSAENVEKTIRIVASLYGQEERGEELIRYMEEMTARTTERLADVDPDDYPSILYIYDDLNVSVSRYDHWMVTSGGNNPAVGLGGKTADVNMEQILLWNPDIIYIGNFTQLQPSDLLENKLEGTDWSLLNAVKNKQVYKVPIGAYRWDPAGVETPLMIEWAAKIQYPELFADVDIKSDVKEFYKTVYDFALTDEMLSEILDDIQN